MTVRVFTLGALAAWLVSALPAIADEAWLIRNARIVDGTGSSAYSADLRIKADRIAAIGALAPRRGETVVDASGLVLAPGFIDTHSHHERGLETQPEALPVVAQGVTTIVINQDGFGSAPLGEVFEAFTASPAAVNIAAFSGHNYIRGKVMKQDAARPATPGEIAQMGALVHADMQAGALGLSSGLEYEPGRHATPGELLALARIAAADGGRYISHIRSEDRDIWPALDELLAVGRDTGMPVQLSHAKLAMPDLWGQADRLVAALENARSEGVEVSADIYPYDYWYGLLDVLWPKRDFSNRATADYIVRHIAPPDALRLVGYPPETALEGRTLAEIARARQMDPAAALIELAERAEAAGVSARIVCRAMDAGDVARLMQWAHANIASDGFLESPHPRGAGSFPRVLRVYVREDRVLSLEEAVHKMSGLAARHMGIRGRGEIRRGNFADLVLFDPETVADRATIEHPQAMPKGISRVWVNGTLVFANDAATGRLPGRVVRRGD
jgi:N-acyl-D-amino-acid deacylase